MEMTTNTIQRKDATPAASAQPQASEATQGAQAPAATPLVPPVDIVENADGITLTADMPGVSREGLSIGVEGDQLTIEGAVSLNESQRMQNVYAEIRVAQYKRTFVLSRDLDTEKIEARLQHGVLTLRIPKSEQAKPRRIEVKSW